MPERARRSDLAFTPAVKRVQRQQGTRERIERVMARRDFGDVVTPELTAFIAERDSFYVGTASADGQPYIQHRGGPKGFLHCLDDRRLAFADYCGNGQYITLGNLSENARAFLFLMDYHARRRVKFWGRAEVRDDEELRQQLDAPDYSAIVERVIVFHVAAWDANCPQHIRPR